jgi:hypothetical protein
MGSLQDGGIGEDYQDYDQCSQTIATITSSEALVLTGDTVDLTITEENTGDVNLYDISVEVDDGSTAPSPDWTLVHPPNAYLVGNTDNILEPGEKWEWTISGVVVNADTTYTARAYGKDPADIPHTYNEDPDEEDSVTVNTISPDTEVTISASETLVYPGDTVDLTVTEENTATDPAAILTNVYVEVDDLSTALSPDWTLVHPPDVYVVGNTDNILEPGEKWQWTISGVVVNADTTYTATGHGTDPLGNDVTHPQYPDEQIQ